MNFTDVATISGMRKRDDGSLLVNADAARTGIQIYAGSEVGKPEMARVRVFRGADEVFHRDSLSTFTHRPITNDHPPVMVDASNWRDYAVGQTADEVTAHDIYVRVPLMISDAATVSVVEGGKRELSVGYTCDLDFTPGITKNGETFDARQRNIRVNHIAIVDRGRAGDKCRIGDTAWIEPVITKDTKKMEHMVIVDGGVVQTDAAGAAAIKALQVKIADMLNTTVSKAVHDAAIVAKDTEIGTLKAENVTLKASTVDAAKLDAMVKDRTALITLAKSIVPTLTTDGVSDADIRKAVVADKMGGAEAIKDASEAEISGMFKALAKDAKTGTPDPMRQSFMQRDAAPVSDRYKSQNTYEQRLRDAWKGEKAA